MHDDFWERGQRREHDYAKRNNLPWARLTDVEIAHAGDALGRAHRLGHKHLLWHVPHEPYPIGAVWPELALWAIPVEWPYNHGPVTLTARWWGRRYVVEVIRAYP